MSMKVFWSRLAFKRSARAQAKTRNCGVRLRAAMLLVAAVIGGLSLPVRARQSDPSTPVVIQPGAPGQPSKTLPPSTRGKLPPRSHADVEFMQGMIMHHQQAVEMTA